MRMKTTRSKAGTMTSLPSSWNYGSFSQTSRFFNQAKRTPVQTQRPPRAKSPKPEKPGEDYHREMKSRRRSKKRTGIDFLALSKKAQQQKQKTIDLLSSVKSPKNIDLPVQTEKKIDDLITDTLYSKEEEVNPYHRSTSSNGESEI